jgi:hypothetical protein
MVGGAVAVATLQLAVWIVHQSSATHPSPPPSRETHFETEEEHILSEANG